MLHQFRFEFDAEQDRIVFRLKTTDDNEYLLWFTRRYVRKLLENLGRAADSHPDVVRQSSASAQKTVAAFRREAAIQKTDFSKSYDSEKTVRPLGDEPILVSRLRVTNNPKGLKTIRMSPRRGKEIGVTLTDDLLHSFLHLLTAAVARADWSLGNSGARPAPDPARPDATLH
ncbi:MAG: hypothetical protein O2905_03460 [Proteobacteria bacterium]|nr:hypothetical protein [Pseudomonadota bacterium]MDA1132263.1 hypothetical protein [Pseudomonadota bacterium]